MKSAILKLHHAAYRCRDSEETRQFYEDFLGLSLIDAFEIKLTATRRSTSVLHSFFAMADGSCIAFFEDPEQPFDFKDQNDFDLHIALEVSYEHLQTMFKRGTTEAIDTRGITDHGAYDSIYFRDPNGYVIELTANKDHASGQDQNSARQHLQAWQKKQRKNQG
jgi:catechol 2,3-dioxygenase-like lactoylglutathione lyase family enzyme